MTLWTFVEAHITNIEMKHDALMKIAVNMHSLFGPIWQIFLPVYHRPSKNGGCFICSWVKNESPVGPQQPQIGGIQSSFFLAN